MCVHAAPKLIVYDNACNLHRYCLNRVGTFFQNTNLKFIVDPFHMGNHVTCSRGYRLDSLPARDVSACVNAIRTPAAEFANRHLRKLDGSVNTMTQARFMTTVRYHLHRLNNDLVRKHFPAA